MSRIIRCIRIDEGLWNDLRKAVKEDDTYISHVIEGRMRTYLLDRTINKAQEEGHISLDAMSAA